MGEIRIRDARPGDAAAISAIVNREIAEGVNIWDEAPRPPETVEAWRRARVEAGYCVIAAEQDGEIVGYAALGPFRPHSGYKFSTEHSIYVHPAARGRGVGRALLVALLERGRAAGFHVMIGGIEAGNAASLALHAALGFRETARMPEIGRKFDRWLTLVLMQRVL